MFLAQTKTKRKANSNSAYFNMPVSFLYNNVRFLQNPRDNSLMVKGEILNMSTKSFNAIVFRIVVFVSNKPSGHLCITFRGFYPGQTKVFEESLRCLGLSPATALNVLSCEIFPESSY